MKCNLCLITAIALSIVCGRSSANEPTLDKPWNVLFLVADDLNSWLLEDADRYAGKVVAPNLRKFAASGVNFTRAYTAAPVCSPSRTAFFSGVSPWHSGHYHNALQVQQSEPLNNAFSLAGCFKQSGYTTACYGKITHGWDQKEQWDEKVGHKRDPAPPGSPLTTVGRGEQDWGPTHLAEGDMNDTGNADLTIAQLQKQHDEPFFIAFGTFNPHMPWYVPQKYFDMFPMDEVTTPQLLNNDLDDVPPLGVAITSGKGRFVDSVLEHGLHKDAVQAYLATTAYVDAQMGRVLDALDRSPYKDNTIVVFLSDHGFHLGEKHHWQNATLWEEATHCLLMFRVPGVTRTGCMCQQFVSLQDIYPTLADLCSLDRPSYLDGRSLVPLLKVPNAKWDSTAITCLSDKSSPDQGYVTIRNESGRYIRYAKGQEEFYVTTQDPHEWANQIDNPRHAETIETLKNAVPSFSEMATPLPPVQRKREDDE
ncbi:sulfatase [uncultured Rubinisphaera sp.]|uniref:sulfatase n=1 Tax=uncultured Rubinisphaera sp. TaxID=1678686 RepID=UPI0030DC828F